MRKQFNVNAKHNKKSRGFTLIELMVAVAIVAILSAIAIPSYRSYILKAQRTDGKEALLRVQIEQEKWRTNNTSYTATLGSGGLNLSSTSPEGYYGIAINSASATGYVLTATRTGDGTCNTLTLTVTATGETKTPANCW